MSYTIIRSISFKKDGVYLTLAESNIRPIYYQSHKSPYYTKMFLEKGRDAVLSDLLVNVQVGSDVFMGGSKLDKLRYFTFEWWAKKHGRDFLVDLKSEKSKPAMEHAVAFLTKYMKEILDEFQRTLNEKEEHIILVNDRPVVKATPDRSWNRWSPGDARVKVYTYASLIESPWDENFPWKRCLVFPNRFEAEYFARCRLSGNFDAITLVSEKGREEVIKYTKEFSWFVVQSVFKSASDQREVLSKLYDYVTNFRFKKARKVVGYPRLNPEDHKRITELFMEFDRKHHPDVIPGGLWLNAGFSSDKSVPKGHADLSGMIVEYEKPSTKADEKVKKKQKQSLST